MQRSYKGKNIYSNEICKGKLLKNFSRTIAGLAHPIQHKLRIPAHAMLDMFRITTLV